MIGPAVFVRITLRLLDRCASKLSHKCLPLNTNWEVSSDVFKKISN